MLINIQPRRPSMALEVILGEERRSVGVAHDDAEAEADIASALVAVNGLARDGLFVLRDEIHFELEFHFTSSEDWRLFLDRPKAGGVEADLPRLERVLSEDAGRIVATEETVAAAYKRAT